MATEEEFLALHEAQLRSIQFPTSLTANLCEHLRQDCNNDLLENVFEIRKFENSRSMLFAKKDIKSDASFYLIDHIWTNDGGKKAYKELKKSPKLLERVSSLFCIPPPVDVVSSYDVEKQVDVVSSLCGCTKDKAEKVLDECGGSTLSALVDILDGESNVVNKDGKSKRKKKDCSFEDFKASLAMNGVEVEKENAAYLERMYENFLLEGEGCANTLTYNWSDDGNTITVFVSIPGITKKDTVKSTLNMTNWKLVVGDKELINGEFHATVKPDECYWAIESPGVLCMTLEKVYEGNIWPELIKDESQLSSSDILSTGWIKDKGISLHLSEVLDAMWMYNQTYAIMSSDGVKKQPVWYIMDEYGSALIHSIDPNFRCSPFFHVQKGRAYSLIWPVKDVDKGTVCTRNFIPQIMQNETLDICKVRLKAFTGKKIHKDLLKSHSTGNSGELGKEELNVTHVEDSVMNGECNVTRSVDLSAYGTYASEEMLSKLKLTIPADTENADICIKLLKDTYIRIDSDVLPSCQMISNKQYLQSYLKYRFEDFNWFRHSYILPRDLEEFNKEYELTNLPQYWILKTVDRNLLEVPPIVSSSFSRIIRMCETGPVAVSKYVVDQPQLHRRRFTLEYTIVVDISNSEVFVYKVPFIRLTKKEYSPNAMMNEYDNSCEVTERPTNIVCKQEVETYKDFEIAMNRLLLPKDHKKGWASYQNIIFQRIGILTKPFVDDLVVDEKKSCYVLFSIDVILDDNIDPIIIDINDVTNLPNKDGLSNILELACGCPNENFVKII